MNDEREQILSKIRRSLGRADELPGPIQQELLARTARAQSGPLPAIGTDLQAVFMEKLTAVSGTCVSVNTPQQVITEINTHLTRYQLPPNIVRSTESLIEGLPWPRDWAVEGRVARGDDLVSVTSAFAAIAETGTLALVSGPRSPTTLRFLPDDHIVVIEQRQIVAHVEDVWKKVRNDYPQLLPRSVNLITGPSRTADVEQTIQLGAHGPRRLHVIILSV